MRTGSFLNALFKGRREAEVSWFSWGSSLPVVSSALLDSTMRAAQTRVSIGPSVEKPGFLSRARWTAGRTLDDGSREAMDVSEGQKVLFQKYAGTEFKLEGEELLIVSQKDILAIVED